MCAVSARHSFASVLSNAGRKKCIGQVPTLCFDHERRGHIGVIVFVVAGSQLVLVSGVRHCLPHQVEQFFSFVIPALLQVDV